MAFVAQIQSQTSMDALTTLCTEAKSSINRITDAARNTVRTEQDRGVTKLPLIDDAGTSGYTAIETTCSAKQTALASSRDSNISKVLLTYTSFLDKTKTTDAVTKECHAIEPKLRAAIAKVDASASQRYVDQLWDACAKRNNAIRAKASADKK